MGVAAIVEDVGVGRIELDGLVVVLDRAEALARFGIDEPAVFVGAGIVRLELDGSVVVVGRTKGVAVQSVGVATGVEGIGILRVQPDGLVEVLDRRVELVLVEEGKAAIVVDPRELFTALASRRDDGAASLDGLVVGGLVVMAPFLELLVALRLRRRAHGGEERQDRNCLQHVTLPYPACRARVCPMDRFRQGRAAGLFGLRHNSRGGGGARSNWLRRLPPGQRVGPTGACRCLPEIALFLSHLSAIVVPAANCGGGRDG